MADLGSGTTRVVVLPGAGKKYTEFWCVVHQNSDTTFSAIRTAKFSAEFFFRLKHISRPNCFSTKTFLGRKMFRSKIFSAENVFGRKFVGPKINRPLGAMCESLCFPFPTLPQLKPETRADPQAVVIHSPGSCHPPAGSCHPPRSWGCHGVARPSKNCRNLQTAEKSRGWLRFRLFFDQIDRVDPI